ncbi:MAG: carboxypeptidase-like regulatory domain-containing protein [Acidobacteriia bacterium]|nr:carboxypeptidase-like regulatory domain-containing protein [Terriglobia bacterium]
MAVMPVAAFCLAYPDSGFLVWRDNVGWFETPIPAIAIGLAALFYAVLLPPFWIWPGKKRAAIVFLSVALLAVPIFVYSRWTIALLPRLAAWSSPFALVGLFWLRTDKSGWPSLLRSRPCSPAKRVLAFLMTLVGILGLDIVLMLTLSGLGSSLFSGDCRGKPPFVRPLSPTHAVFTAKVLFAGRSIDALLRAHGDLQPSDGDGKVGDWAIGFVQERFWGMPHWTRLVLLTNFVYWEGETYFFDGRRVGGVVTQFLPIVEGGIGCSRTKPIQIASIDLRLLRNPPAPGTSHVMGYVRGPEKFRSGLERPIRPAFIANAQIEVTGPAYRKTVKTDSAGVYELDDLAPGEYTLQLSKAETQEVGVSGDGSPASIHIDSGGVVEMDLVLIPEKR